jgi:hypothetical protein
VSLEGGKFGGDKTMWVVAEPANPSNQLDFCAVF